MFRYRHIDERGWAHYRGSFLLSALARAPEHGASGFRGAGEDGRRNTHARSRRQGRSGRDGERSARSERRRDADRGVGGGGGGGGGDHGGGGRGGGRGGGGSGRGVRIASVHAFPGHVALVLRHTLGQVLLVLDVVPEGHQLTAAHRAHLLAALGVPAPSSSAPVPTRGAPPLLVALFTSCGDGDGGDGGAGASASGSGSGASRQPPREATVGRVVHVGLHTSGAGDTRGPTRDAGMARARVNESGGVEAATRLCVVLSTGWVWWWQWAASACTWQLLGVAHLGRPGPVTDAAYSVDGGAMVFAGARGVHACTMTLESDVVMGSRLTVRGARACGRPPLPSHRGG